jgi:hypothetical protein
METKSKHYTANETGAVFLLLIFKTKGFQKAKYGLKKISNNEMYHKVLEKMKCCMGNEMYFRRLVING